MHIRIEIMLLEERERHRRRHRPETRETWVPVSALIVTELCRFMPLT